MSSDDIKVTDIVPGTARELVPYDAPTAAELLEDIGAENGLSLADMTMAGLTGMNATDLTVRRLDGEEDVETLRGVVVHIEVYRTYHKDGYRRDASIEERRPECSSIDAREGIGDNGEGMGVRSCAGCPLSAWNGDQKPRCSGEDELLRADRGRGAADHREHRARQSEDDAFLLGCVPQQAVSRGGRAQEDRRASSRSSTWTRPARSRASRRGTWASWTRTRRPW